LTHATAQFIAYFVKLDCPKQQMYVMNWYRAAFANWKHNQTNNSKDRFSPYHYEVPILSDPDNNLIVELDKVPPVCMSAIQIVSGKRVSFWRTCMCHVQSNTIPKHGLVGKPSNNSTVLSETIDELRAFFKEIKDFCDIVPMRFVREKTGLTTRDDGEKALTLPPYWSKQGLFSRWCYEHGWNVTTTSKGQVTTVKQMDWPDGADTQPVVSWLYFWTFWKTHYSYISIR
jgi:hypothetical protein